MDAPTREESGHFYLLPSYFLSRICRVTIISLHLSDQTKTTKMKNIVTRSLSGVVYVALIVAALLAGTYWFMALMALFAMLAVREFQTLTSSTTGRSPLRLLISTVDIAATVALCLITYEFMTAVVWDAVIIAIYLVVRVVISLYDTRPDAFAAVGRSVLSVIYIGVPLALAALLNNMSHKPNHLMLIIFIMIWLNDTGAYCVGCTFGRHRLFERLSPKKSWEGFWGGLVFCVGAGAACSVALDSGSMVEWIGLGLVVCVFSTWGDLFESLMKRSLGVKDSGHLIPGHGGILDRIDSLLLVAPACFVYSLLTGII